MSADEQDKTIMMEGGGADGKLPFGGEEKAPPAKLICLDDSMLDPSQKGLVIPLVGDEVTLGRGEDNTCPIKFHKISRNHARLYPMAGKWVIEDLNSTNGVWVDETRTKEARLRPGNYVKIGAIPFQFQLERPDAAVTSAAAAVGEEDEDGEGTMMFGTEQAAEQMIAVEAELKKKTVAKPVTPEERSTAPSMAGIETAPKKKGKTGLIVGLLVVLAIAAGVGFQFLSGATGEAEVSAHRKAIKSFAADAEEPGGIPTDQELTTQLRDVRQLTTAVQADANKFPENPEFQLLLARLLFFDVERQVVGLIQQKQARAGSAIVQDGLKQITAMEGRIIDRQKGKAALEMLDTVKNMLLMMESIIAIKQFREKYPEPSRHIEAKPSAWEMDIILNVRNTFVEIKKSPQTNTALAVHFPFLRRLVTGVDEDDLPTLNQWRELVQ